MAKGKGAAPSKNNKKINEYYEISGSNLKRRKDFCPKCGDGVFLGEHANRSSCGKCGYTEFKKA